MKRLGALFLFLTLQVFCTFALAGEIKFAVTTSFENSGLSDALLPEIRKDIDLEVQLIVVGTGQALKLGRAGDVDAILVHSSAAEEQFIAEGYGMHRREIMYNDFVLVGPSNDPAGVAGSNTAAQALSSIAAAKSKFVSRGDDSGTHRAEIARWKSADLNPEEFDADWYRAVGAGMGASLNAASAMNAYILSDRASWLKFKNKGELKLLFSGDPLPFNQYAYLQTNPAKHPHVKSELANALEIWLTSDKGQQLIGAYTIDGQTLFIPNAKLK